MRAAAESAMIVVFTFQSIPDQDDCQLKWPTASDLQAGSCYGVGHHATVDIVAHNDDGSNGGGFP
jgi:hypothetical protein